MPSRRAIRRSWLRRTPVPIRIVVVTIALVVSWAAANWAYQVARKPSELIGLAGDGVHKNPADTWREYGALFQEHSTPTITADLIAALAQVESAGNPVARTYWRWRVSWNPFEWYRPASSAVGMLQITDATFKDARRYCIHHHAVAEAGGLLDLHGCWFNSLYTRTSASDAIEMTSALLDHDVALLVAEAQAPAHVTLRQKQNLAIVTHLCGLGGARIYLHRRFNGANLRCGDERVSHYLALADAARRQFATLRSAMNRAPAARDRAPLDAKPLSRQEPGAGEGDHDGGWVNAAVPRHFLCVL